MTAAALPYVWRNDAWHPLNPHFARRAREQFGEGEIATLEVLADAESSDKSRAHQFAWLREAWLSLPEHLSERFPTETRLRKWALISAGFHDEEIIDAGTRAAAERVAAFARRKDDYAEVVTRGPLVVVRTAKSQSRRSMDKAEFQASKEGVLRVVSELLGVEPSVLQRQGAGGVSSPARAA